MSKRKIQDLDTPALLLELPTMESNLRKMAKFISQGKAALRPHFKNHQNVWLSKKQLEAGAIGISSAPRAHVWRSRGQSRRRMEHREIRKKIPRAA